MKLTLIRLSVIATAALFTLTPTVRAQVPPTLTNATLTTLYTFPGLDYNQENLSGAHPSGLVQGSDGNFYGTTSDGGNSGSGTVFSVTPAGVLTTLYTFSATDDNAENSDGSSPYAALVRGSDGNFYGTTVYGGANGLGTIFSITPAGVLTTLHTFSANGGGSPGFRAALVQGNDGSFYGTTGSTVFSITPAGVFTTLYTFSAVTTVFNSDGINSDGFAPQAALVQGSDGNFYGTTSAGGAGGQGTVFSITPAGVLTTLHTFSAKDDYGDNSDGATPYAPLVQGKDGNFYGTTQSGGTGDSGTIFSINPVGVLTTLYTFSNFSSETSFRNGDGGLPLAALLQGSDGNFYGTASQAGNAASGTLFSITPAGIFTLLYTFSAGNGDTPSGALVRGSDGNFYGTTFGDYRSEFGTVFKLSIETGVPLPGFFTGEAALASGVYYLAFPSGNDFGYYSLDFIGRSQRRVFLIEVGA